MTKDFPVLLLCNVLVALSVSFVALSLGAAFGILAGRGAFAGMLSAGIIAFIAATFGGTRVQCSGPTAPMAAIMAVIFASATVKVDAYAGALGGMTVAHFLNLICLLCGGFMMLMGLLRLGRFITLVPETVISGFMTGIGLLIWLGQLRVLFGVGAAPFGGAVGWNAAIAFGTFALTFAAYPVLRRIHPSLARFMPGTLFALVVATLLSIALHLPVAHLTVDVTLHDGSDLLLLVVDNIPLHITHDALKQAWFYGLELALISYLDTLMVALVIDRLRGETTKRNKELAAQGFANVAIAFVGGVPGTQASIRSIMMTQEGATMRLSGMLVGVFVVVELLLCQDIITLIPNAVFMGILFKVGWNVIDRPPIIAAIRTRKINADLAIIMGTALVTLYNLCLAVVLFTALHYAIQAKRRRPASGENPAGP